MSHNSFLWIYIQIYLFQQYDQIHVSHLFRRSIAISPISRNISVNIVFSRCTNIFQFFNRCMYFMFYYNGFFLSSVYRYSFSYCTIPIQLLPLLLLVKIFISSHDLLPDIVVSNHSLSVSFSKTYHVFHFCIFRYLYIYIVQKIFFTSPIPV